RETKPLGRAWSDPSERPSGLISLALVVGKRPQWIDCTILSRTDWPAEPSQPLQCELLNQTCDIATSQNCALICRLEAIQDCCLPSLPLVSGCVVRSRSVSVSPSVCPGTGRLSRG